MPTVTILHISDLHYSPNQSANISIIRNALTNDLEQFLENSVKPDIVIFSGDLVLAGENPDSFGTVRKEFLEPVLECLQLGNEALFIAPGNHDISRKRVRDLKYVDDGLRATLVTVDEINKFLDNTIALPTQNAVALDRLALFDSFQADFGGTPITANPFVRTYLFPLAGTMVGLAALIQLGGPRVKRMTLIAVTSSSANERWISQRLI